ncbi:MAG: hypothetical protein E7318_03465 [Clostridiales bacterium]|nr:hypothetical protein [Clostridiales bacterium]
MSKKFNFSSIVILLSGLLSCAAGVLFQKVNGRFGTMNYDYYNPYIAYGLMAVAAVALVLMLCKLHGLASLAVTAVPGFAFCAFFIGFGKRAAYWHVADVFMQIDEQAFDPNYLWFCGLMVAAFLVGEIAVYLRKPGQAK